MQQNTFFPKVAIDMFLAQLKWSLWFISFLLLAHIVMLAIPAIARESIDSFLFFSHGSSKIYMLVIGIISAYGFLSFYVSQGITRRDYFYGSALAACGISLAIAIIAALFTGMEHLITEMTNLSLTIDHSMTGNGSGSSSNTVSNFSPKEILDTSILAHSGNWLVSILMYALSILTMYTIGWLIGAGYYRFGWIAGFGFIAMAIVLIVIGDLIWGIALEEPLSNWLPFSSIDLPLYGSFLGAIVLIGIILALIRIITKRVAIKL
ncbi:hypothetical protein [Oceanobacillus massiliensis]|uniref:hypothetical protein n=1 Tax=Oceanobacillus massiliensis TaxID=1465765 RepID=UPI0002897E75|nr:hypothetical protein [Oceanobacillus massiliensis]